MNATNYRELGLKVKKKAQKKRKNHCLLTVTQISFNLFS